ncbi:MAG TPA: serine hydrolase [Phenylobacterium sp.]|jgi:CubicO group peptidase (beta-lactamase class C family)
MRKLVAAIAGVLLALSAGLASADDAPAAKPAAPWAVPSDAEIRQILVNRIDVEHRGVGIVVGVIDAHGRRIVAYGRSERSDPRPLDAQTIFEIGSMTKVFTSLLLSDMAAKGEVRLDDPVAKYLPATVTMPQRGGKQITLVDLATHTSGLPRLPGNLRPKDPANPYADYSVDQMYQFLSGYSLPRDIGSQYEYSNLGGGLLGHVLARRAGVDYETLVRQRITSPLRMDDTVVTLPPRLKARLAKGHDAALQPAANWDLPTLVGAGGLRSDAKDILTFLGAELGYVDTPVKSAMKAQLGPRRPAGSPVMTVALGWHILSPPGKDPIVWHNGGTGGYRTFMGFDAKTGVGVVVLTNAATATGGDDIGFHLLSGTPLSKAPAPHTAIEVDSKLLETYVGRYQFTPKVFMTVTRYGNRLFAVISGQAIAEIFPESPTKFFWKVVDAQVTFEVGPDGRASGVVLHQDGRDVPAKRVEDAG